jgi:hypothetical protein
MALGSGTSHEQYTNDGREQIGMVGDLREAYQSLKAEQLGALRDVADEQDRLNGKLREGASSAKAGGSGFDGLSKSLGALKGQLAAVAGAAAAVGVAVKFVGDETKRLADIADGAKKSGLGVEEYQRLEYAATMGATSIETLSKATLKLELNLRDIQDGGGKKANSALAELGLRAEDLAGLSATNQLATIADALGGIGDQSTRGALAVELLGKSATELMPLLSDGGEGLREMSAAAGDVFTAAELAQAEAYQDSLDNLDRSIKRASGSIALALAPAFQEVADSMNESAKGADSAMPAIRTVVKVVGQGLKPIVAYVKFFADGWVLVGRAAETASGYLTIVGDKLREVGGSVREWLSESWMGRAAGWISDTAGELRDMAGNAVDRLSTSIRENVPYAQEMSDAYATLKAELFGTHEAFEALQGLVQANVDTTIKDVKATEDKAKAEGNNVEQLTRAVDQADHLVRLGEAQKIPAAELEQLYRNQHAAKLEVLLATKDTAALEAEMRDEEVRQAKLRASRSASGGGRGPTDADRLKASGEIQIKQWQDRLRLMELAAEANGEDVDLAAIGYDIRRQELELEAQVLEITKAKGSIQREQNAARLDAIVREQAMIDYEQAAAAREKAIADQEEAAAITGALAEQRAQAATNVISLDAYRLEQQARSLEAEGRLGELYTVKLALIEQDAARTREQLDLRAELLALENPEGKLEQIQHQAEVEQLAHDRTMAIAAKESAMRQAAAAEQQRLFEAEKARKAAAWQQAKTIADQGTKLANSAAALSTFIVEQTTRDEDKRAKAKLRAQGAITIGVAAGEAVQAAAAYASLNIPQGLAHTAAAVLGFAQGGIMLAGQIPGQQGGTSASASGAAAPRERNTSEAATNVDSTVSAADRGPRRIGGSGSKASQGGINIVFEGDINGSVDEEFAEKMARAIKAAGYGSEAAA